MFKIYEEIQIFVKSLANWVLDSWHRNLQRVGTSSQENTRLRKQVILSNFVLICETIHRPQSFVFWHKRLRILRVNESSNKNVFGLLFKTQQYQLYKQFILYCCSTTILKLWLWHIFDWTFIWGFKKRKPNLHTWDSLIWNGTHSIYELLETINFVDF